MTLNIFQQTNPPGGSNVLVGALYNVGALPNTLGSLISSFEYTAPYTGQTQEASWTELADIAYIYVCWISPDGTPSGTVANQFDVQPSAGSYNVRDNLYLVAGSSPNMLANGVNQAYGPDSSLPTWNWYIESVGVGTLQYGVQWQKTVAGVPTTQDDLTADGWVLLGVAPFQPGQDFVIHFLPQIVQGSNVQPAVLSSVILVTATDTLTNSAMGSDILVQGTSGYLQVNLPSLASVPPNTPLYFTSEGGSHTTVGIFAAGSDLISYFGLQSNLTSGTKVNHIYLCQMESAMLIKYVPPTGSPYWMIVQMDSGYKSVGEIVTGYENQTINKLICQGQLVSRTTYARLWEWVQTLGPNLISDANVNAQLNLGVNNQPYYVNWGYFTNGDGSSTFRLPNLTKYGFLRYNSVTGGLINCQTESHTHTMHGQGSINDGATRYWLCRNVNGGASGGGSALFGFETSPAGPDTTLRTGPDNGVGGSSTQYETYPTSVSVLPLIRI